MSAFRPGLSDGGPQGFRHRSMNLPERLLAGTIDTHVHAGPVLDSNPGHADPLEIALEARERGMRGVVYYDVFGWASGTAWLVNRHVPGIRTFGGYLMNSAHGGLNPRAVRTALHLEGGCRMISFGSHCTYAQASGESTLVDGVPVPLHEVYPEFAGQELSRAVRIPVGDEPVTDALAEILTMVAEHPEVYLNTGHVSHDEVFRVVELAEEYGIGKVLVSHPARGQLSVDEQKELAGRGVFLEGCLVDIFATGVPLTHYYPEARYIDRGGEVPRTGRPMAHYMEDLRAVGSAQMVLGTDYGVRNLPTAVEGMRTWIAVLLDYGFPLADIRRMTAHNPARLLGLPELDDTELLAELKAAEGEVERSPRALYPQGDGAR
ncbi:hypothetical protein H9Y04_28645 [Streptomyces sp. TRM66268-LWL]|uniref:Amidohydrolase n=1 Tax=Streptomyces polyasparticus TaxID=2767826 RepID=A0ABR7SM47_9ACTN|nr:DUF6282 family protein [Streptomyces polyasparticus]MBC9716508.1 hypothetical protein [Streptomyces polyasparticus]